MGSTYDSILSSLVSISLLQSAVGKDNPAEERAEGPGSPLLSSVTHEHKTHWVSWWCYLLLPCFWRPEAKLSLILIFLTRYLLQLYVLSFSYCQRQENKSLGAEPGLTCIRKLIMLVKTVQMIWKWQREHCGHSALYSSSCVCVALNLKGSNVQVYLSVFEFTT